MRERTYGMALPRCTIGAGRAVYDERAATRPFLGAHPVQLELSVRATLCDQCIATLGASSGALWLTLGDAREQRFGKPLAVSSVSASCVGGRGTPSRPLVSDKVVQLFRGLDVASIRLVGSS